jgi:crotonobetainyl-CoA:carnitine CoA-transferase CaiB-like acyl-CoA transferase
VIIAAANDRQFRSLCEVLDLAAVAADDRFRTNAARTANRDELHPILVARLRQWSADDLFLALNRAGVPCGPINSIGEGVALADRLGLDPVVLAPESGPPTIRNPIEFDGEAPAYRSAPPGLGQHSDELRQWLLER